MIFSKGIEMNYRNVCILILALFVMVACARPFGGKARRDMSPLPALKKIAVLPMDRSRVKPGEEQATCSLSDTVITASEVSPQEATEVTNILFREVMGDRRFTTVPVGQCIGFLNSLLASDVKASTLKLIRAFGRELGVDGVLYGKLYRFKQRIGGPYSVKRPASVAFSLHLIRVADGRILWSYTFDETQKPLSEDIFKAGFYRKTGMKWLTAGELATFGLSQAIEELKKRLPSN